MHLLSNSICGKNSGTVTLHPPSLSHKVTNKDLARAVVSSEDGLGRGFTYKLSETLAEFQFCVKNSVLCEEFSSVEHRTEGFRFCFNDIRGFWGIFSCYFKC